MKFGKLMAGAAVLAAGAAAAYMCWKKVKEYENDMDEEFDDFDDWGEEDEYDDDLVDDVADIVEEEDLEAEVPDRSYVTLTPEEAPAEEPAEETPAEEPTEEISTEDEVIPEEEKEADVTISTLE